MAKTTQLRFPAFLAILMACSAIAARLFASGLTKLVNFQSDSGLGGSSYGVLDEKGNPRPAYASFLDYLRLALNEGRRLPVALAPAEGNAPLHGVYAAAARHADASITLVLNPADVEVFQPASSVSASTSTAEPSGPMSTTTWSASPSARCTSTSSTPSQA